MPISLLTPHMVGRAIEAEDMDSYHPNTAPETVLEPGERIPAYQYHMFRWAGRPQQGLSHDDVVSGFEHGELDPHVGPIDRRNGNSKSGPRRPKKKAAMKR